MKMSRSPRWIAACLAVATAAFAQTSPLALKHGTYVAASESCSGAPNAAIKFWDGVGFSGAHASRCTSTAVRQHGAQYKVTTSCAAQGDGSPNPGGKPYVDAMILTRLSGERFAIDKDTTYRWCSAGAPR